MPWNEESTVSQRRQLIEKMRLPGANISELCAAHNISRKTAYKWLARASSGSPDAYCDQNRQPKHQPRRTPPSIESEIIQTHLNYPFWGPYKLQQFLLNEGRLSQVPSHPTIAKILARHGCEVIKSQRSAPATKRFERRTPNELWQMDFKGSFMTRMQRCYPLTVLDDYSRFSLAIRACPNETSNTVQAHLMDLFRHYGLPKQINVDNGNPWGASDLESHTSMAVWLMKLGVRLSHSAPYHPQTNGKEERFHRTLKLEVLHQRQYKNLSDIQMRFDDWRDVYNFKRPHQGINNQPPGSRYQPSVRTYPERLPHPEYDYDAHVRRVAPQTGYFRFKGKRYRAGKGFGGELIALYETAQTNEFAVYFMDTLIKKIKLDEGIC